MYRTMALLRQFAAGNLVVGHRLEDHGELAGVEFDVAVFVGFAAPRQARATRSS
jgi:hypothetical protein